MSRYSNEFERAFHELRPAKLRLQEVSSLLQSFSERFSQKDPPPYDLDLAWSSVHKAVIHLARARSLFAKEAGLPRQVEIMKEPQEEGPVAIVYNSYDPATQKEITHVPGGKVSREGTRDCEVQWMEAGVL